VVPFDKVVLNEGGAMNAAAGVFTVPVDGIYHFDFSAMKYLDSENAYVHLEVNEERVSSSYATGALPNLLALNTISVSLRLKMGDQVRLFKTTGTLNDNVGHYTHFSGWLVEEDLVLG